MILVFRWPYYPQVIIFNVVFYPNFTNGINVANGFMRNAKAPVALTTGTFLRINLDGLDGATGLVEPNPSAVPVPGEVWLFGSALLGFAGFGRKKSI